MTKRNKNIFRKRDMALEQKRSNTSTLNRNEVSGFQGHKIGQCCLECDTYKKWNWVTTGKTVRIDPDTPGKEMGFYFSMIESHWMILRIVVT